jgi:hypothetical protein
MRDSDFSGDTDRLAGMTSLHRGLGLAPAAGDLPAYLG